LLINVSNILNDEKKISKISLGKTHVLILTEDNILFGFGINDKGQLGIEQMYVNATIINDKGILKNKKIIQISSGYQHSLVLLDSNELYSFGCNEYGQLVYY
jgi:alpha-tubulin suppressor-like RCC1 family protein